jgi:hypothetical protein
LEGTDGSRGDSCKDGVDERLESVSKWVKGVEEVVVDNVIWGVE